MLSKEQEGIMYIRLCPFCVCPGQRFCFDLRSGFHRAAIPVHMVGLGGPGAPHHFEILRRGDAGALGEEGLCYVF